MTDAPERIWAASGAYPTFDVDDWENASASAFTEFGTEYIRADLLDEAIMALDAAERQLPTATWITATLSKLRRRQRE